MSRNMKMFIQVVVKNREDRPEKLRNGSENHSSKKYNTAYFMLGNIALAYYQSIIQLLCYTVRSVT